MSLSLRHVINFGLTHVCSQDLRSQLTQERDSARHAALQKDLELKELRTRIDKLVSRLRLQCYWF